MTIWRRSMERGESGCRSEEIILRGGHKESMIAVEGTVLFSGFHEDVAREAFERGVSISSLCSQALLIRQALRSVDPWKTISETWEANANVDSEDLQADIEEALSEVRKA